MKLGVVNIDFGAPRPLSHLERGSLLPLSSREACFTRMPSAQQAALALAEGQRVLSPLPRGTNRLSLPEREMHKLEG